MNTTSKTWKRIALVLALTMVGALGIGGWMATRAYVHLPAALASRLEGVSLRRH